MKLIPAAWIFLLVLSVSCKKSNNQTNTAPPATDTIKPPVVKVDTSTLLKSVQHYVYDNTGSVFTDSSHEEWTYDNQRRIIQDSVGSPNHVHTFLYTYSSDHYSYIFHAYNNGALTSIQNAVYYQRLKDRTDSILSINTGYGIEASSTDTSVTYFYYNQNGQDSLEKVISRSGMGPKINSTLNYYYTGQNLDSTISGNNNIGHIDVISYYTNGNHTSDKWFQSDGTPGGNAQYTFTNIPVGGLHVLFTDPWLPSGTIGYLIYSNTTNTETDSYQFDSVNRVSVWLINSNGHNTEKWIFNYY